MTDRYYTMDEEIKEAHFQIRRNVGYGVALDEVYPLHREQMKQIRDALDVIEAFTGFREKPKKFSLLSESVNEETQPPQANEETHAKSD